MAIINSRQICASFKRVCTAIAFPFLLLGTPAIASSPGVVVTATVDSTQSANLKLKILVKNESATAVSIGSDALPWVNGVFGIELFPFVDDRSGKQLKQLFGLEHSEAEVVILPGKTIEGEILLAERLPSLVEVRARNDVILFWSHKFVGELVDGNRTPFSKRFGGMVMLPRITKGPK